MEYPKTKKRMSSGVGRGVGNSISAHSSRRTRSGLLFHDSESVNDSDSSLSEEDDDNNLLDHCTWFNECDRQDIVKLLFDENLENQKKGLSRLEICKVRSHPSVPLGIDVTSALLTALIASDEAAKFGDRADLTYASRMQLGTAVVRFYNMIVEAKQHVDIPAWVVRARHNASHSFLPSTEILRRAVIFGLEWIKKYYWSDENPVQCLPVFVEEIINKLQNPLKINKTTLDTLKSTKLFITKILTSEGVLLITAKQLELLKNKGIDVEHIVATAEKIWRPFLKSLQMPNVSLDVLKFLITELQESDNKLHQRMGLTWIESILEGYQLTTSVAKELREMLCRPDFTVMGLTIAKLFSSKITPEIWKLWYEKPPPLYEDSSEDITVLNDEPNWKLELSESWKEFPIGMDKDDPEWVSDKFTLVIPTVINAEVTGNNTFEKMEVEEDEDEKEEEEDEEEEDDDDEEDDEEEDDDDEEEEEDEDEEEEDEDEGDKKDDYDDEKEKLKKNNLPIEMKIELL